MNRLKELRLKRGYTQIKMQMLTGIDQSDYSKLENGKRYYTFEQCRKLDLADIEYNFFYLTGICGKGGSTDGVLKTSAVFNQLNPKIVGASMLTVYPSSELYGEIQNGNWQEESENEKLREMRLLIEKLEIKTHFAALGASNMFKLQGDLPYDKTELIAEIDSILNNFDESRLRDYRLNLKHL